MLLSTTKFLAIYTLNLHLRWFGRKIILENRFEKLSTTKFPISWTSTILIKNLHLISCKKVMTIIKKVVYICIYINKDYKTNISREYHVKKVDKVK